MLERQIKLTSRLPLIVAASLLVVQIFSPSRAVMFMLVILAGVLSVSYFWARQLAGGVSIQHKRRYGWAQVGDVIEERWIMHNDGWVPVLWAEVRERSDLVGYDASRAIGLGARASRQWTTTGVCEMRGIYTLGPLRITMGDPFGMFEVILRRDYTDTYVVYPAIAQIPDLVEPRGLARGVSTSPIRSLDQTTNASTVRAYAPGDALNRIHWRTTARRSSSGQDELYVKEFDLEPSGDVWMVLDMEADVHAGKGPESTEEYAVTLTASLASKLLRNNQAVGLMTHNDEPVVISPSKGHQQLWEVLRCLAGLHATSDVSMQELVASLEPAVGRGMSVALVTPSARPEWIEAVTTLLRHGTHVTAILLDAASFGADQDLGGVRGALADLGVVTHTIAKGFDFPQIAERRRQKPEYRVLEGTGRVVVTDEGEPSEWVPVGYGGEA